MLRALVQTRFNVSGQTHGLEKFICEMADMHVVISPYVKAQLTEE